MISLSQARLGGLNTYQTNSGNKLRSPDSEPTSWAISSAPCPRRSNAWRPYSAMSASVGWRFMAFLIASSTTAWHQVVCVPSKCTWPGHGAKHSNDPKARNPSNLIQKSELLRSHQNRNGSNGLLPQDLAGIWRTKNFAYSWNLKDLSCMAWDVPIPACQTACESGLIW